MVKLLFNDLLGISPYIEVLIKNLYWRMPIVQGAAYYLKTINKRLSSPKEKKYLPFDLIASKIVSLGVVPGDILIIHTSGKELQRTHLSPVEIINSLIHLLGPEGTLVAPAIPFFLEEHKGSKRLTDEICSKRLVYDIKNTPSWTGVIPNTMLKMIDAKRSRHPLNTTVAIGKHAEQMMRLNIAELDPTACGINSSWKYCADRNAKILFLGVDAAHNMTMIHVAEDAWEEQWPINGWYRHRDFIVKDNGTEFLLTVRERHPKWSMYYAERTLQKDLINNKILLVEDIDGFQISFCESKSLLSFLNERKRSAYPYWIKTRKNEKFTS